MFRKVLSLTLHQYLLFSSVVFIIASVALGLGIDAYDTIWWWDDVLHATSGVILAFMGLVIVRLFNERTSLKLTPLFVALFVFCISMTVGVLWEIFEFFIDYFFGMTMQKWNLSEHMVLLGQDYQGAGLNDTMSDLILAFGGSLIGSTIVYFMYKEQHRTFINKLRKIFSDLFKTIR